MVNFRSACETNASIVSVLALSSRFDGPSFSLRHRSGRESFQYSLCRVVLMVLLAVSYQEQCLAVSVLALSSRFDGPVIAPPRFRVLIVSVLALSSRFDGP